MITITAGANLQAALDAAPLGETLQLEAGATFLGNFVARGSDKALIGAATLRSPNSQPALRTEGAASRWRLADVTCVVDQAAGAVVQLGDGLIADAALLPRSFVIERCTIRAGQSAKNGLEMNAADVTLQGCQVLGVKSANAESHALIAWNSPGPFLIEDCVIEAGSAGTFFGGAKPALPGCIPSDLVFRRNRTTRPLVMQTQTGWGVKNLFEAKNLRRAVITGNIFEHNWVDGQSGYAIVFTVRANSPTAPWTTIQDVRFESNLVRGVASAFNILGLDNQRAVASDPSTTYPSTRMDGLVIRNNLIADLDRVTWKSPTGALGGGLFVAIDGAPLHLTIEDNTAMGGVTGNIASLAGDPMSGLVFRRNVVQKLMTPYQTYGVNGNVVGEGNPAISAYCPDAVIEANVLAGCSPAVYSSRPNNLFPTVAALQADFVDPAAGNYRLKAASVFFGRGCDQDAIEAAIAPPPPPCTYTVGDIEPFAYEGEAQFVSVLCSREGCPIEVGLLPVWLTADVDVVGAGVWLSADAQEATEPRSATITIAGVEVEIVQSAAPTLAQRITEVAAAHDALCGMIGGNVSPQDAARQVLAAFLDAVLLNLPQN